MTAPETLALERSWDHIPPKKKAYTRPTVHIHFSIYFTQFIIDRLYLQKKNPFVTSQNLRAHLSK